MNKRTFEKFTDIIGYRFENKSLLDKALTHSSTELSDNENLEFLGDTVLSTIVSDYLYAKYPNATEGELTIRRAQIVNNRNGIYSVARSLSLSDYVKVGKSFPKNGQNAWRKLLANALEALIGAVYLDGGMEHTREFVLTHFQSLLESTSMVKKRDSKSKLQEYLQSRALPIPIYNTIEVSGEMHDPNFTVSCQVEGLVESVTGQGSTKKEAEQEAAAQIYDLLQRRN